MATNGVSEGQILAITAGGAVTSGSVQEVGADAIGVALNAAAASGDVYPLATEGIFEVAAKSGESHAVGDKIYWDTAAVTASKTYVAGAADCLLGICVEAMASATTTKVKLRGGCEAEIGQADAVLTGAQAAVVAPGNVIGGVPVTHMITVPAAAGTTALILTHKTRILRITAVKTHEAGLAGGTLEVRNGATIIATALTWDNTTADKAVVPAVTLDDAQWDVAAAGTVNVVTSQAQARGVVILEGVRVA